jgi:hypothetical protein
MNVWTILLITALTTAWFLFRVRALTQVLFPVKVEK